MNAQQARQTASSITSHSAQKQFDEIKRQIDLAASDGKFSIHTYETLVLGVKTKLIEEGFLVDYTLYANEVCNTISW